MCNLLNESYCFKEVGEMGLVKRVKIILLEYRGVKVQSVVIRVSEMKEW